MATIDSVENTLLLIHGELEDGFRAIVERLEAIEVAVKSSNDGGTKSKQRNRPGRRAPQRSTSDGAAS